MKKVINGKMYNTETAECVFETSGGYPGNFNYYEEDLYKKRTGEFFLYGWGGAASPYAEKVDCNTWGSGKEIRPLTEAEAKKFVEENGSGDEYEEIFGEVEE